MPTLYEHVRLNSQQKGSRLLVLLFIASHLDAGKQPSQGQLAKDSRMSVRQVTRIVDALELSGELKVDRSGGHTAHAYTIASDNVDKMATLNKKQHGRLTTRAVGEGDGTNVDKMATLSDAPTSSTCHVKMSTLSPNVDKSSTFNVDNLSGTPLAPLRSKNTSTDKEEANASSAQDAVSLKSYIGRLIQFRESELGTKLPKQQAEGAAAKWMYEQGWSIEDVQGCYRYLVKYGKRWRQSGVTLNDVKSQIADWKKGNLRDDERFEPQRNGKRTETTDGRDYSVFDGPRGADVGANTRPIPRVNGLAAPSKR